jgi:hypothetical protein
MIFRVFKIMWTKNLSTKIVSNSLVVVTASIASLAGSLLVTPTVSAQTTCFDDFAGNFSGESVICGDKVFDNFGADATFDDRIVIDTDGTEWTFEYTFNPEVTAFPDSFSFIYDVEIRDPNQFFDVITLGTTGTFPGVTVVKEIFASGSEDVILTLTSENGSPASGSILNLNLQHIAVLETIVVENEGVLISLINTFTQGTHETPPVPEPSTILGLLAVGGFGLVTKFRKQK